jgi:hypothetical protein
MSANTVCLMLPRFSWHYMANTPNPCANKTASSSSDSRSNSAINTSSSNKLCTSISDVQCRVVVTEILVSHQGISMNGQ